MRAYWKPFLVGVGGVVVALSMWHGYQDHKALHDIITFLNQVTAQQAQAQKTPGAK